MTRNLLHVSICVLLTILTTTTSAQKLTVGEYTGVNFSNLRGNLTYGKWEPKPGPMAAFIAEYHFSNLFSLQTELNYLVNYYGMKQHKYLRPGAEYKLPGYHSISSYYLPSPYSSMIISPSEMIDNWDFSFLRVPLLIRYHTPTRLELGLATGFYYSFLINNDLTRKERNAAEKENRDIYPPTHDWGYLVSTDISFPLTQQLRFFAAGRLSFGKNEFIERYKAKNGATEILLGLKFAPNLKRKIIEKYFPTLKKLKCVKVELTDNTFSRWYMKVGIGTGIDWNHSSKKTGNYGEIITSNGGITVGYRLDETVSVQTGLQIERKGYALNDSSIYSYRYASSFNNHGNDTDTKVLLDYLTIPLKLRFSSGHPFTFYTDIGTYTDIMLNAICRGTLIKKYSSEYSYRIEKVNLNDAVEGYYKPVNWGYIIGMGFQFPFRNNMKFDLGINYSGSFNNVLKKPEVTETFSKNDLSILNGRLAFQFGILFPLAY